MSIEIRNESTQDWEATFEIQSKAFRGGGEAKLVEALRASAEPLVSLVAKREGSVVGHIMFSPVTVEGLEDLNLLGLGPLAVDPDQQKNGIGSLLVERGLDECKQRDTDAIFVLGNPSYYSRFGFEIAAPRGFFYKNDAFAPYFMVKLLTDEQLRVEKGEVVYRPEFELL